MDTRFRSFLFLIVFFVGSTLACVSSPTGRKQLMLVSQSDVDRMGIQSFQQLKASTPIDRDAATNAYVRCVALPITRAAKGKTDSNKWEFVVFKDPSANAFALPGNKIGVYSGILKLTRTQAQLATVLGHEVGHVIARHAAERVSDQLATGLGLEAINAFVLGGNSASPQGQAIMAALGVGAQVGVLLPFSRTQEAEADQIGLKLMAQAGFNPRQSIAFWRNMMAAHPGEPPVFLSDHPGSRSRVQDLEAHMKDAVITYDRARARGLAPSCDRSRPAF